MTVAAQPDPGASTHVFARTDRSALGIWWWTVDRWLLGATLALIGLGVLLCFGTSPAAASRLDLPFPFTSRCASRSSPSAAWRCCSRSRC